MSNHYATPIAFCQSFDPSPADEAIASKINNWDLNRVKRYLVKRGIVKPDDIEELEREYKRFIFLSCSTSHSIPISRRVDEMWHAHILFTRDYIALGREIGGYVHHCPAVEDAERLALASAYEKTLAVYEKYFGRPSAQWWPITSQVCMGGDGEGDCSNQCGDGD